MVIFNLDYRIKETDIYKSVRVRNTSTIDTIYRVVNPVVEVISERIGDPTLTGENIITFIIYMMIASGWNSRLRLLDQNITMVPYGIKYTIFLGIFIFIRTHYFFKSLSTGTLISIVVFCIGIIVSVLSTLNPFESEPHGITLLPIDV